MKTSAGMCVSCDTRTFLLNNKKAIWTNTKLELFFGQLACIAGGSSFVVAKSKKSRVQDNGYCTRKLPPVICAIGEWECIDLDQS